MRNFIWRDFFVTSWFISGMPSRSNRPWQLVFLLKLCRWAADSRFFQENPIAMWSFGRYSWQHLVSTASGVSWERHQFSLLPFRRAKQRVMGLLLLLSDLSDIIVIVCYSIITISILLLYIHIHIYIYTYIVRQCRGGYLLASGTTDGAVLIFDLRTLEKWAVGDRGCCRVLGRWSKGGFARKGHFGFCICCILHCICCIYLHILRVQSKQHILLKYWKTAKLALPSCIPVRI